MNEEQELDNELGIETDKPVVRVESERSCCGTRAVRGGKLHTYDWLQDLPVPPNASDLVEVQFKNTRKAYYRNTNSVALRKGDLVAVESSPGHDIGEVTLIGRLVYLQMHKNRINPANYEFKRVYRVARPTDLEKWEEAKALEQNTMLESRKIAEDLHLNMKIGDVEYQGDRTKAIFYYIADERVDFRELIKVLADRFHVRIEMRQIGARQEAGRIGGIGPCGRELCCASWMTSFVSVATNSARLQDISLNPLKLAGQCAKLKCCLNYELDVYLDALQSFPPTNVPLETEEGTFYFFKYDVFQRIMWYSPQKDAQNNIVAVPADRVREIQAMNQSGQKPDKLGNSPLRTVTEEVGYSNVIELDDLTRFDKQKGRKGGNGRGGNNRGNRSNRGRGNRQPQSQNAATQQGSTPNKGNQRSERPQSETSQDNRNNGGNNRRRQGGDRRNNNNNRGGNRQPRQNNNGNEQQG